MIDTSMYPMEKEVSPVFACMKELTPILLICNDAIKVNSNFESAHLLQLNAHKLSI